MGALRKAFRSTPLWDVFKKAAELPDYYYWRLRGSPMRHVPHLVKQRTLRDYARRYALRVMVETGTNLGQMIAAMLPLSQVRRQSQGPHGAGRKRTDPAARAP